MIKDENWRKYETVKNKWHNFRRLRAYEPDKCVPGTKHFLPWRQRENMFELLLNIIEKSRND